MRLTNKSDLLGYTRKFDDPNIIRKITHKLGQLEDVEERLGVDLVTLLCGLLDDGIVWVRLPCVPIRNGPLPRIVAFNIAVGTIWSFKKPCYFKLDIGDFQVVFYLKDYGKTWAFDREELL